MFQKMQLGFHRWTWADWPPVSQTALVTWRLNCCALDRSHSAGIAHTMESVGTGAGVKHDVVLLERGIRLPIIRNKPARRLNVCAVGVQLRNTPHTNVGIRLCPVHWLAGPYSSWLVAYSRQFVLSGFLLVLFDISSASGCSRRIRRGT